MKLSQKTTDNLEHLQASLDQARSQGAESAAVRAMALVSALRQIGEYQKGQALCSEVYTNPALAISTRRMARYAAADIDMLCGRHKQAREVLLPLKEELSRATDNAPALLLRVRRALCKAEPRADQNHAELRDIFEQQRALQGLADEDTQRTIHDLAHAMGASGHHRRALDWLTATIDALKDEASPEQLLSLSTLLADLRQSYGDISGLQNVLSELLAQSEALLGSGHPQSLRLQMLTAHAEIYCGDFDGAARRHQLLLKSYTELFGPDSLPVCWILRSIAQWHEFSGERHKAIPIQEDLLRVSKEIYGDNLILTRSFHREYAISVGFFSEYERSIELHEKLIRDETALFGSDDLGVLCSKSNLVLVYNIIERTEEASRMMQELIQTHQSKYGEGHRYTLSARARYIEQQLEHSYTPALLAEIQEIASQLKSTLGPLHQLTINSHQTLSNALMKDGQHKKATEVFIEDVLQNTVKTRSSRHQFVFGAYARLIYMLIERERWNEALQQTIKLENALSLIHAPDSDTMLETLRLRSDIYIDLKDYPKAELVLQRVYSARKNTLPQAHAQTLSVVSSLLLAFLMQNEHEKIVVLLEEVLAHDLRNTPDYAALVEYYVCALIKCDRTPTAIAFVRNEMSRLTPDHPDHGKLEDLLAACRVEEPHKAPPASVFRRFLDWFLGLFWTGER